MRSYLLFAVGLVVGQAAGCRTPTVMTVRVLTDVPCEKQRGAVVAVGAPSEYELLPPAGRAQRCTPLQNGLFDLGTIVVTPRGDREDRVGIRAILGVARDAEACTSQNAYAGCIVGRRVLHYLPHTELAVDILLRQDCADVACDANTTCVDRKCGGAEIDPAACVGVGCGESALPTARRCDQEGAITCAAGERLTCSAGILTSEPCGIACSSTRCVAATSVTTMAASGQRGTTCALVDRDVWCFGDNGAGRLGVTGAATPTPAKVPGLPPIVQLRSLGTADHVVALDDTGAAWCWGKGDSSQCGSPAAATLLPRKLAKSDGTPLTGVVQVTASSNSTCVRLSDGSVQCVGSNSLGQLGRGMTGSSTGELRPVIASGAWSGKAIDLACASNACCVVDDKHHVACFGNDNTGQIGAGLTDGMPVPTPTEAKLPGLAHAVRAGDNALCALLDDRRVACWGNPAWDVFLGPTTSQLSPVILEGLTGKGVVELAIAMESGHFAVTPSVTYGWGTGGLVKGPLAEIPALAGATSIAASFHHACAVVSGAVLCWGEDANGALGDGTTTPHALPAPVKFPL